ncbi:peptidoglycan-binding domain-containing protein [Thioclava sp. GXIMD4216]|uniref:Peptidoglycan-binding domain-containing protein n=1 Tax=Thioclava litoralis TaxID=3076557 RepID=A0ABZ1E2U0_9RHOB|nr:peptidoglycan-binding domain-containing protein [Thioclava sp. FTW29]
MTEGLTSARAGALWCKAAGQAKLNGMRMAGMRKYVAAVSVLAMLGGCMTGDRQIAPRDDSEIPLTLANEWRDTPPDPAAAGCYARQTSPAVVETVTEQRLVSPEIRDPETGKITQAAAYHTETRHQIVTARGTRWFAAPCPPVFTQDFVVMLQRALAARGYYHGGLSGSLDRSTGQAIHAYQKARGLYSATLSTRAAQELGLTLWSDKTAPTASATPGVAAPYPGQMGPT